MTPSALTRLILQRTRPYAALVGKEPLREWTRTGRTSHLVAELEVRGLVEAYTSAALGELELDALEVLGRLLGVPRGASLVSIGPGGGHVEAILADRLGLARVLLVDTEEGGRGHGMQEYAAAYCDLGEAAERVQTAAPWCAVVTWNPSIASLPSFRFDALISLYAMGFHFPRDLYAEWIAANRKPGAVEIFDTRNGRAQIG